MKIAYLVNQYPTVSHSFIRREILALEALGISVTRFSHRSCAEKFVDKADQQEFQKTNVVLSGGVVGLLASLLRIALTRPRRWFCALQLTLTLGWQSLGWLPDKGILRHFAYLAEACVLLPWLSRLGISHIHAHFGTYSTTVALLCHVLGGLSYSFTVHGPEEFDNVRGIALTEKIKRATFVIAVSSFCRSQLYRWCEYGEWSKINQVGCGLDEEFFSLPWQSIPDEPRFVCVGRLSEQKGQLMLIEAADRLLAEGFMFKLVLVGDGSFREQIETAIANSRLEETVEITGWATEAQVQQQILASRAMVLPSFAEGLPVVIMESLALGRPVISTYVAGIPELVEPNLSGWLIPAGSVEALVTAMRTVLQTPISQLEQMGKMGRQRVAQQHNIQQNAEKLAHLFTANSLSYS